MTERRLRGVVVSPGVAIGPAYLPTEPEAGDGDPLAALARVAEEYGAAQERLAAGGRDDEAEILAANRLMAEDPSLLGEVETLAATLPASEALRQATDRHADALAALGDSLLSARAADVRELGRRAVRALSGAGTAERPPLPSIVVARELGPAELLDLGVEERLVLGIALAEGSATSHAAIIARSLGIPMVAAAGDEVLGAAGVLVVDATAGDVVLEPSDETFARVRATAAVEADERARLAEGRSQPAVTASGKRIRLLANASTTAEAEAALERGAEGVGLLRTELAFLDSAGWPTEDEHVAALEPVLSRFEGRVVTVRTLDFGADKTPPFLRGNGGRGIALMLEHEDALAAQLAAIVRGGAGTKLRIMLPLVESPEQLETARRLLPGRAELGAMIETPVGVERAAELAAAADFFSIGTNDLVATALGLGRESPLASPLSAGDPVVVELMRRTVEAAHAAGITVEVCGEAAGEPELTALLVGLGVDELSVSPARLDAVREAIRRSGEPGDEVRERGHGRGGVLA